MKIDFDYLLEAYKFAAEYSTDPSTQNAAIIVAKSGEEVFGANHFPRDVKDCPDRWVKPLKYSYVEHSERNAIYACAKAGICTENATMFCPWFSCADCARGIIQAGIKLVVGHDFEKHKENTSWAESSRIGEQMLTEAGVEFYRIKIFFGIKIRFNGEIIEV